MVPPFPKSQVTMYKVLSFSLTPQMNAPYSQSDVLCSFRPSSHPPISLPPYPCLFPYSPVAISVACPPPSPVKGLSPNKGSFPWTLPLPTPSFSPITVLTTMSILPSPRYHPVAFSPHFLRCHFVRPPPLLPVTWFPLRSLPSSVLLPLFPHFLRDFLCVLTSHSPRRFHLRVYDPATECFSQAFASRSRITLPFRSPLPPGARSLLFTPQLSALWFPPLSPPL